MKIQAKRMALCLAALFVAIAAMAQVTVKTGGALNPERWVNQNFGKGKIPPFSFNYDGRQSSSFITKWKHSIARTGSSDGKVTYVAKYTDPATGLEIAVDIDAYKDYDAVEWKLTLTNTGNEPTKQIKDVLVADVRMTSTTPTFRVHYNHGSDASRGDFTPILTVLSDNRDSLDLWPKGGRSSDGYLPFFNIETTAPGSTSYNGVIASIGWTGTWQARMNIEKAGTMQYRMGQKTFNAWLKAGESVRTPLASIFFWHGDNEFAGNNQFRQFMLYQHTKKIDGKPTRYPVSAGYNWGSYPQPCNEYECHTADWCIAVQRQQEYFGIHPEVMWLDAGWFGKSRDIGWYPNCGTWEVDKKRFPNGLNDLSQEAHRNGQKFLVWFEPERVMPGTKWRTEHPEWMLHSDGKAYSAEDDKDQGACLMDMRNPEAVEFVSKQIGDIMDENGIDYYRQDYNIAPDGFWWNNDAPDRRGISEAKYIAGLYKFWDNLLNRFPHMLIDNCASGGRRLDIETMQRSAPLWRTDYNYGEPNGYQCHTYGLSMWLPQSGTGCSYSDPYSFRSSFSAAVEVAWKVTERNANQSDYRWGMNEFYTIKDYFLQDYYPLVGVDRDITGDNIWLAYQLNHRTDGTGYVVAFRRQACAESNQQVKLYGLNPTASYRVHNCDNRHQEVYTGKQLMTQGITLSLERPRTSLLIRYELAQ